jgi:outer membrane protein TolC
VKTGICVWLALSILVSSVYAQTSSSAPNRSIELLEAVQSTLINHPLLRIQELQIEITRGLQEQASGQFDLLTVGGLTQERDVVPLSIAQRDQNALSGFAGADQTTNRTSHIFSANRLFRNGVNVASQLQLGRSTDNLFNAAGLNSSNMSLSVTIPLLRGRGRQVVAAQEYAARKDVKAAMLDLNQLVVQLAANTADSYWNLVAARKGLAIAEEAERRGQIYLNNVQALVAADHVPRNDLNEVTANLAQRSSARLAADQQLVAAQQELAQNMGLDPGDLLRGPPQPAEDFPSGENQQLPSDDVSDLQYYLAQALERRADYLATDQRVAQKQVLVKAATNALRPQINLNLSSGYSGLQEGRQAGNLLSSATSGLQGPNAAVGLTYTFSGNNHGAKGLLRQAEAQRRQAELAGQELSRNITTSIVVAVKGLRSALVRLKQARQSVEAFSAALAGERNKYSGGIGSIIDILTVEDKLTAALTDQVQAQLTYALELTQFRFVTGTLVTRDQDTQTLKADTFVTLPFTGQPQEHQ